MTTVTIAAIIFFSLRKFFVPKSCGFFFPSTRKERARSFSGLTGVASPYLHTLIHKSIRDRRRGRISTRRSSEYWRSCNCQSPWCMLLKIPVTKGDGWMLRIYTTNIYSIYSIRSFSNDSHQELTSIIAVNRIRKIRIKKRIFCDFTIWLFKLYILN